MAYDIILINGEPFKCIDCGCITMKLIDKEKNHYECQNCGSVYEKS